MGAQQPFIYDGAATRSSGQYPEKEFDPKAVTRASWEPKPKKPKREGPFITFNRHPDAHAIPPGRSMDFRPMSGTSKWWIKFTRRVQLGLRCLELVGGLGLVALMILISEVEPRLAWVMRIVPGVVAVSCIYSIYHHARPARVRPPASAAAYQCFSAVHDLATAGLYGLGAALVHSQGGGWTTLLGNKDLAVFFVRAEYYTLIVAGGLHVVSLAVSTYLGLMFRRIARMPPDMNPLEDNLTRRAHKRNKSSVATTATWETESTKRLSTPLEDRRRSGAPYEEVSSRPPSIPFMHTREGSRDSFGSSHRDSRSDLPSRQYQIVPGSSSPPKRNSAPPSAPDAAAKKKHMSAPLPPLPRGGYAELPLHKGYSSRPNSVAGPQGPTGSGDNSGKNSGSASPVRAPRFMETWYASESLVNRTQQRQRAAAERAAEEDRGRAYEALAQPYGDGDGSDSDRENDMMHPDRRYEFHSDDSDNDSGDEFRGDYAMVGRKTSLHPNPLRLHPPRTAALSQADGDAASGSRDIADEQRLAVPKAGGGGANGRRDPSFQGGEEALFYARPYGDLRSATPPVMVGSPRQVSSGTDYHNGHGAGRGYRRNVSGRAAEEGMAGPATAQGGYSGTLLKGLMTSMPA
ncbi:hypothetical protein DL766_000859 [Monosporascus sp. MC13-8B]|uniref:MARVEL domain-containing protein n=1 Tax=Monosporascus cannonballus TaxID=155416 RepID=A0ABY0GVF6_9PEZI|nr:hypothetical protein DL762_010188 [Monosporascus cannonballus]RYO94105.1 hypothetical protein DL763_004173 [Monosporascus cannonballus]RYP38649.1 hypothetical protein DL766_000859 [Monosporascus sp. MC13-8B]